MCSYKSEVAAKAAQAINPALNVRALQSRVSPDSEDLFDDDFWGGVDVVVNALDNVDARLYVDQRWALSPLQGGGVGVSAAFVSELHKVDACLYINARLHVNQRWAPLQGGVYVLWGCVVLWRRPRRAGQWHACLCMDQRWALSCRVVGGCQGGTALIRLSQVPAWASKPYPSGRVCLLVKLCVQVCVLLQASAGERHAGAQVQHADGHPHPHRELRCAAAPPLWPALACTAPAERCCHADSAAQSRAELSQHTPCLIRPHLSITQLLRPSRCPGAHLCAPQPLRMPCTLSTLRKRAGSSRDPPEKQAPMCTLRSFPHNISHCLTFARSEFEGLLEKGPAEANAFLADPAKYLAAIRQVRSAWCKPCILPCGWPQRPVPCQQPSQVPGCRLKGVCCLPRVCDWQSECRGLKPSEMRAWQPV